MHILIIFLLLVCDAPHALGHTKIISDLGESILLHAKVHAFAQQYLCPHLLKYSRSRLRKCFKQTEKVSSKILPRVADAIGQIYSNTPSSESGDSSARQEITNFVVSNHTKLIVGEGVDSLCVLDCGFMRDLIRGLSQRLIQKEKYYIEQKERSYIEESAPRRRHR